MILALWQKRREVGRLIRFDRPYGTLLLLLPTLWSLVLASEGHPSPWHLFVFIAGSFLMRSAGCVANDLADRKLDAYVARTRNRPLAAGTIGVTESIVVLSILLAVSLALVLTLNLKTILLSFPALFCALLYPFCKRWIHVPQMVLGIAFSFGILMAWTAVRVELSAVPVLLFLANLCWTTAYDTIYAMMDREDDLKIGVKSTAILFGTYTRLAVGILYALVILFLAKAGVEIGLSGVFYLALGGVASIWAWQTYRLSDHLPSNALFARFHSNVYTGLIVLAGIILHYQRTW